MTLRLRLGVLHSCAFDEICLVDDSLAGSCSLFISYFWHPSKIEWIIKEIAQKISCFLDISCSIVGFVWGDCQTSFWPLVSPKSQGVKFSSQYSCLYGRQQDAEWWKWITGRSNNTVKSCNIYGTLNSDDRALNFSS